LVHYVGQGHNVTLSF